MKRFVITGTVFTILLATVSSIEHFLDDSHYNPGFYEFPWIISLHVAPGAAYLLLVVLQLTPRIRADRPDIHRNVGRLTVALGLTSATTAVLTTLLFPFSGPAMILFVTPFALYFGYALIRGFNLARQQQYQQHREWMIRALAIASAIATQRLILIPALAILGTDESTIRWVSMFSFTAAFTLHLVVSEIWLQHTRQQEA